MRRRMKWLWHCLICGHREYDGDGLEALEGFEAHYRREHMTKESK